MLQLMDSETRIILLGCSLQSEEIKPFMIKSAFHVQDGKFNVANKDTYYKYQCCQLYNYDFLKEDWSFMH